MRKGPLISAISISISLFILISACPAFDVSPKSPQPGDRIVITGIASPGARVPFQSSFTMSLPVTQGEYEYETNVVIPLTPNRLSVTPKGVKDLNVGVRMVVWLTLGFEGSGGTASVSHSDIPPGSYDVKMFGAALEGEKAVTVSVRAETTVLADSTGRYDLVIDTSGIPAGDYTIEGGGETKVVHIGGSSAAEVSGSGSAGSVPPANGGEGSQSEISNGGGSQGQEITPDVIRWYAGREGLDANDSVQYAQAQGQLENILSGGYWKVIARGMPLTEKAGNCEDKYCLVRGRDACTTCREEEMLAAAERAKKSGALSEASASNATTNRTANVTINRTSNITAKATSAENATIKRDLTSNSQIPSQIMEAGKAFFSRIIDWLSGIFGGWIG